MNRAFFVSLSAGSFPLNVDLTLSAGAHTLRVIYSDTFEQTVELTISFTVGKEAYCRMGHNIWWDSALIS